MCEDAVLDGTLALSGHDFFQDEIEGKAEALEDVTRWDFGAEAVEEEGGLGVGDAEGNGALRGD